MLPSASRTRISLWVEDLLGEIFKYFNTLLLIKLLVAPVSNKACKETPDPLTCKSKLMSFDLWTPLFRCTDIRARSTFGALDNWLSEHSVIPLPVGHPVPTGPSSFLNAQYHLHEVLALLPCIHRQHDLYVDNDNRSYHSWIVVFVSTILFSQTSRSEQNTIP